VSYDDLIARKSASTPSSGFDVGDVASHLFPHQRDLVRWALRRGRAAIFADTGLGKGLMLLEWARHVAKRGRVIILAPLAVGPQLAAEALRFGVDARYLRTDDPSAQIVITNYEMLHAFSPEQFTGVVLDESSILKSYDGKTKQRLLDAFSKTPYRLACTATPAPNDFTELGNHSEFLGLKSRVEMLAEYFVHDGGSTQDWRIKGHALTPFWRWVATWGAVVKLPSDLGYEDGAFSLPALEMREHVVPSTDHDHRASGMLFAMEARTLQEQRAAKRGTISSRVTKAAELIRKSKRDQFVVWCDLNDEQDAIADELGDLCVSIQGSTDDEDKLERHEQWLVGKARVLVSKPAIFGFGLNWQHCHRVIFIGASHSYERTYQAIRRCWRFGQAKPVTVDLVRSDLEAAIVENYRRKESDAAKMAAEMTQHVGDAVRAEVRGLSREFNPYQPAKTLAVPGWL
jgi:superfamily II DNA or RNA helicase